MYVNNNDVKVDTITLKKAWEKIYDTKGKIFKVVLRKRDGTFRKIICRLGVKKDSDKKGLRFNPDKRSLLGVYDMEKLIYTFINLNLLAYLIVAGERYKITIF